MKELHKNPSNSVKIINVFLKNKKKSHNNINKIRYLLNIKKKANNNESMSNLKF